MNEEFICTSTPFFTSPNLTEKQPQNGQQIPIKLAREFSRSMAADELYML